MRLLFRIINNIFVIKKKCCFLLLSIFLLFPALAFSSNATEKESLGKVREHFLSAVSSACTNGTKLLLVSEYGAEASQLFLYDQDSSPLSFTSSVLEEDIKFQPPWSPSSILCLKHAIVLWDKSEKFANTRVISSRNGKIYYEDLGDSRIPPSIYVSDSITRIVLETDSYEGGISFSGEPSYPNKVFVYSEPFQVNTSNILPTRKELSWPSSDRGILHAKANCYKPDGVNRRSPAYYEDEGEPDINAAVYQGQDGKVRLVINDLGVGKELSFLPTNGYCYNDKLYLTGLKDQKLAAVMIDYFEAYHPGPKLEAEFMYTPHLANGFITRVREIDPMLIPLQPYSPLDNLLDPEK